MRKRFARLLLTFFVAFSFLWGQNVRGAHLMGGDLTYKYIGNNTYALQFLIYRDANCTSCLLMPTSLTYYSYAGSYVAKSDYSVYTTHNVKLFSIGLVKPVAPNCSSPNGVSVQQGVYLDTLTDGNDSLGYHITWFAPGYRNGSIIVNLNSNLCGPYGVPFSMLWYTFIPNNSYKNSSPQFLNNPIPYLCVGQTNTILPTCSDPDNDSLVFSLQTPYSPPACAGANPNSPPTPYPLGHPNFQEVVYKSGYSVNDPFGNGSTSISIDPQTGVITATPKTQGAYVIAIQVQEYRYNPVYKKSVYMDFVRRDLEFIVGNSCPTSSPPSFTSYPSSSKLVVAPGDSLVFDIAGASANGTDSVYLSATGGIFSGPLATINAPYATFNPGAGFSSLNYKGKVDGHFVWKPSCQQITYSSPYTVTFNLSDQSCHTIYQTYQIEVQPRPILTPPLVKCANITNSGTIQLSMLDSSTKPEFLQYKIYRDTNYSGHFQLIDSINSFTKTSYTDTKATNNKKIVYSYYITSQNNCGLEGLPSDTVSSIVLTLKKIGDKRVNITWNAASNHVKNKYQVYEGPVSSLSLAATTTAGNRFYTLASCNGTYRFKVQLTDSTGTCVASSGDTVLETLDDITPPDIDTNLVNVTTISNSSIQLVFNRSDSNDTKFYKIYRSVNGNTFSQIDSVKHVNGQKLYIYTDTHSIDAVNDHYCYSIKAVDSCGNVSHFSNTICQSYITGTAGQRLDNISWHYTYSKDISWILQKNPGTGWTNLQTNPNDTSFTDNNLICNHTYQYRMFEINTKNDTSISDVISLTPFDSITPPKPLIYYATVSKNHSVYLTWTKSIPKVKQYIVYRKAASASKFIIIDTEKTDTFFTDNSSIRPDSGSYCYEVQAMDSCSGILSPVSNPDCTIYLESQAPGCLQRVFLQWTPYSGWASGVSKYEIFRKTDHGTPALIAATLSTIDTFTDFNVTNKHEYTYFIEAVDKNGSFASYSDSSVNSPFLPPTPYIKYASKTVTNATNGQVVIRWKSQATPHIKFSRLFYKSYGSGSFTLLEDNIPVTTDSFVHKNLNTNSADEEYYMVSYDSCGNISDTSAITKTMDLDIKVGQLVHFVNWTPYEGWPVREYYMQMLLNGQFTTVDSVPGNDTTKRRFPAPCNFNIYYRILAQSYQGDMAMSDTAGAKAIDTIPSNPPTFIYTSVVGSKANVIFFQGSDSADTYGYGVFRSDSGRAYQSVAFIPYTGPGQTLYYIDNVNTSQSRHCYYITTMDSCLNTTYSDTFCPIFLDGTALDRAARLQFDPFKGYPISGYELETWINNAWQILSVKKPGDTGYVDTPLSCYTPRYYRVVGSPSSVNNSVTFSDSIMVIPFDTIHPKLPVVYDASAIPGLGYRINWQWDKKSVVKYFEIWRSSGGGKPKYINTVTYDSTYLDSVLPVNMNYRYYVIAIDSCDPSLRSAPSLVQSMMKVALDNDACRAQELLTWTAYSGFAKGTAGYKIYRSAGGGAQTLVATVLSPGTSFLDSNVTQNTLYRYQVFAMDSTGDYSSWSDTVSGVPYIYPVPKPVQIKRATVLKTAINGAMLIEWNYLDRTDPYALGYRLYESGNPGGPFTLIDDQSDKNITSFVETNVNTITGSFYYYIAPYNICNKEGSPSVVHHSVNMQINNKDLEALLTWNQYSGFNVAYYQVYKAEGGAALLPAYKLLPSDVFYNDTNIYCHRQYTYQVYAVDTTDNLVSASDSLTITAFDTSPPQRVSIRSASVTNTDTKNGQVLINFNTVSDKNLAGYIIYRKVNNGPYIELDTLRYFGKGIYQFFDNNLNTVSDTFSYSFRSFDSCGNIALPADTHTVVHLSAIALNNVNVITWSKYNGIARVEYALYRKTGTGSWEEIKIVNGNTTIYYDSNIYCHVFYTYQILAKDTLAGLDSAFSNSDTATAFKTTPPIAPKIIDATVTVTSATLGQIQLNWDASASFDVAKYVVYRRNTGTSWQKIVTLSSNVFSYTDINLDTHFWPYYYMVRAVDSCGNISSYSAVYHRTVNLQATPQNQAIHLVWNTYWGFPVNQFVVYKNGKVFMTFDSLTTSYTDTMVVCPTLYTYMIKAIGVDTVSWSNHDSTVPIDTTPPLPPKIKTVTVSIPNSTVDIFWQMPVGNIYGYRIYRQIGENAISMIYQNNSYDSIYTDQISLNGDPVCYEIVTFDHCGNTSVPSNQGCVINLHGNVKSLEHDLSWNKYQLWADSVDYYNIYRNEDNGGWTPIAKVPASDIQYVDKDLANFVKDFCYRVEAVEKPGGFNATSWSTVVCLNQPPIVYVPNAFTPDYSFNLNDYFGPIGTYFTQYDMKIFNRWGQLVYSTNEGKPWDGTFEGKPATTGVYMYQIDIQGFNGNTYTFKGNVSIVN